MAWLANRLDGRECWELIARDVVPPQMKGRVLPWVTQSCSKIKICESHGKPLKFRARLSIYRV